ncbi:hypothetical protein CPB83DRAFT_885223 [Crepidotus variabilis]|uniref:Aip3p/Bud6 N-terminal domain-containing protein n=1 Tax=Crepidotus variabilis TaxID=179855 RepID=A0A9P6EBK8_9AGAR|nr:hypothetical protein CPB83DRAFT_885223 [Crepidotus variabilis]
MATYHTSHSHTHTTNGDQSWYSTNQSVATPSDVSTAVRKLLSSTRRLQEILKLWSTERATESDVSDVYVQIGHEFNATINAFAHYGIELANIHSIPGELRAVLEGCLAEDPSPQVMETFQPELRKVLYKLLKGLQARQDSWRAATQRNADHHAQMLDLA